MKEQAEEEKEEKEKEDKETKVEEETKKAREEGKEQEKEDRVSELQSLRSAACHGPGSNLNTLMATEVESEEQSADSAPTDVVLS